MRRDDLKERICIKERYDNGYWVLNYEIGYVWDVMCEEEMKNKWV